MVMAGGVPLGGAFPYIISLPHGHYFAARVEREVHQCVAGADAQRRQAVRNHVLPQQGAGLAGRRREGHRRGRAGAAGVCERRQRRGGELAGPEKALRDH